MRLFGPSEQINTISTAPPARIDDDVEKSLPDVGAYFLSWCSLPTALQTKLDERVTSLRTTDGAIPLNRAGSFGIRKWENGPMTFLTVMTAFDRIAVEVWASYGLSGSVKRQIVAGAMDVLGHSGHSAAATWVVASRPQARMLRLTMLRDSLVEGWQRQTDDVTQGEMIKACKRWQ